MASMKAADLRKNWAKTSEVLESGIKKSLGKELDAKDLKDLQDTYKDWKNLLGEAEKKANKWDEKDEKEEEKFKAYLKSQRASERKYENDLKKLDQQVSGDADTEKRLKAALLQANNFYKIEVQKNLDDAHDALTEMQFALVREIPRAIDFQFQRAAKILTKEFIDSLT